jgi:hypothetical protein
MPAFNRLSNKFAYAGMNVASPPDLQPPGRCPFLFNVQPDVQQGALFVRPPVAQLATTTTGLPVHSLIRVNDSVPEASEAYARFLGIGNGVWYGQSGAFTQLDSGYSGNPLSFVPYRPVQSPETWLYTYDSARQQRYTTGGTAQNIGIAAPRTSPTFEQTQPLYTIAEDAVSTGVWSPGTTSGGTTSGPTLTDRVPAGITVTAILYDSGSTGMCSIVPSADTTDFYSWMTAASRIYIGGTEYVTLEESFPTGYNTIIGGIQYDSGSSGLATIVPSVPLPGLQRNMVLLLNGTTYVRVISVTSGPDASYSFRCSTGATTISAGQLMTGVPSFRAYTTLTHAAGASLAYNSIQFVFTPTVSGGSMQDWVATNPVLPVILDLSQIGGIRPTQNEDYMHVSLSLDHPEWITEIHVTAIMDTSNEDYFYYVLRPGDFQPSITGLGGVTTQQANIQSQLDALSSQIAGTGVSEGIGENISQPAYPAPEVPATSAPASQQLSLGTGPAWNEILFKINDMTRVGTNPSLTWNNIAKLGIYFFVDGGIVTAQFGGWWVGGGYGPDCNFNSFGNQAPPVQWRYRYRNSKTGAHSTVSPETLNGEILRRQAMLLTPARSPDPQVDLIDWERRGGTNPDWHYVGTQQAASGTYMDVTTESAAKIADPLEVTSYQPWPVTDVPHQGTALVTGTSVVWQSGDQFNLRWLRGTEIIIGGNTYSLYAPATSATFLQLAENVVPPAGSFTFQIPEATIEGQPLYAAWLDEANNRILACGDPLNPGLLYFSDNDNPDGASDSGYIEVTTPNEPLLNGFYNEGSNYVFTSSGMFRVESTPGSVNPYAAYRLSGVEGMAGPWAFDAERRWAFWWGPDGIYSYQFGPAAENMTAKDLYPLFPHAGQQGQQNIPGVAVSIGGQVLYPPNYSVTGRMRIAYGESFVYATYQNSAGGVETLVYSLNAGGWRKDTYTPNVTHFSLEKGIPNPATLVGGMDGNLYLVASGSGPDAGGSVDWVVLTPAVDGGDTRALKQWGDLLLDYSGKLCVNVLYDNLLVQGEQGPVTVETSRTHGIFDLTAPPDQNDEPLIHYNVALMLTGDCGAYLYEWQPSFVALPEITTARVTAWSGAGSLHNKFVQGIRIHANTFGFNKLVQVQYDGYQVGPTLTINQNGEQTVPFSFATPFRAHMMRIVPLDDVQWEIFEDSDWIFQPEPEPGTYWITQATALGQNGFSHCRELWIAYQCAIPNAVIAAIVDGAAPVTLATLPATTSGPVKLYFPTPPLKGKYWQITGTGSGLQLYERDIEFLSKSWGSSGPYQRLRPFGDASGGGGATGALI